MTAFVVLKFASEEGAERTLPMLHKLQKQRLIQIEDGMILTWSQGCRKPKTKHLNHLSEQGELSVAFWGLLVGLLFAASFFGVVTSSAIGLLAEQFAHYGIDERFIKGIRHQITEGSSALFLMTNKAVMDKVVVAIKGPPFTIILTNLSPGQEYLLREAFGEESLVW